MAYARKGEDSDVYVIARASYTCCGCKLGDDFVCDEPEDMIAHLCAHMDVFHRVPETALELLRDEAAISQ